MNMFRPTVIACFALAASALVMVPGCEDPAAKARAEVQAELTSAADAFERIVQAQAGPLDDKGRGELRSILNKLTSATSNAHAGSGQKSAANLLASDIHRALADSQMSLIDSLRDEQHARRLAIHSMLSAAERINVVAQALETGSVEDQLAALSQQRSLAEEALRNEQSKVAEVNSPLAQLESKIGEARQQITSLRNEENELRREAAELGHSAGFPKYEQAIAIRQQADQIETSSSFDALERDYQYMPTRTLHEQRIEQTEKAIEAIDIAAEELRENAASSSDLARKTRQDLDTLVDRIRKEMDELTSQMQNELKSAVDAAAQDLAAAATKAEQAAGSAPTGGNNARLTAAAASTSLGQLQASWAVEHEQLAALLERFANSSVPGLGDSYRAQRETAQQAKAEATVAAVDAFNKAASNYSRITGGNTAATMESLRKGVEARVASLTGQPVPADSTSDAAPMPDAGMAPSSDTASDGTAGADSPEALAAALQNAGTPRGMIDLARYQTPAEHMTSTGAARDLAVAFADSLRASQELLAAIDAKFGAAAADAILGQVMAGVQNMGGTISQASVASASGDTAQLSVTLGNGQTQTLTAQQIDGRWYVDVLGSMLAVGNPQQLEQIAPTILATMKMSTDSTRSIAQRVAAGEFASPEEVTAAIQKAAQDAMGAMMPAGR